MNTEIKIEGLYEAAYRAYQHISFDPEKRAASTVKEYEAELNEDLKHIPEGEKERYMEGYKKYLFLFLSAKSRTMSSMITGPANFPVERNRKTLDAEQRRYEEFSEWREKALKSIARRVEESRPQEEKDAERWNSIRSNLEGSIATIMDIDAGRNRYSSRQLFVSSITGLVSRLAGNGETELVRKCIDIIRYWNTGAEKPIITDRNSVWKMVEVAEANRIKYSHSQQAGSTEDVVNGIRIVKNHQADRVQLFFDGKPAPEMIQTLKHNAFKWSPSNGCWQRQLTANAMSAVNRIVKL